MVSESPKVPQVAPRWRQETPKMIHESLCVSQGCLACVRVCLCVRAAAEGLCLSVCQNACVSAETDKQAHTRSSKHKEFKALPKDTATMQRAHC